MSDPRALYHAAILEEAAAAVGAGTLADAHASATVDNPLCGDRVSVDLRMDGARVARLAHRVRGCVLCEAAASILGRHAPGATARDLRTARESVRGLLAGSVEPGALPWPGLAMFEPVRAHRSRHECVLLPFDALVRALDSLDSAGTERD